MKTILLIFALLFAHQSIAVAPYGFKGQDQTATQYSNVLKFKNRSVVKTGGINSLVEDQDNLLYNGGYEATPDLDGWTCVGAGSSFTIESKPVSASVVISGDRTLAIGCATVGGCTCTQDFSVNQQQIGRSVLLSGIVRTSSTVQGLKLTYRENGADTSVTTENVLNGIPATEAVIGSSATTIGIKLTVPYSATPTTVRVDEIKMAYGTVVTNQPVITPWKSYTPTFLGFGTPTSIDCKCRQNGGNQEIMCRFVAGTVSGADQGRVSLCDGVTSSDTSVIGTLFKVGDGIISDLAASDRTVLVGPNRTYVTFGITSVAGANPLVERVGSDVVSTSGTLVFEASVPIAQYASSVPTYTGRCNDPRACETSVSFLSSSTATVTETLDFINGNGAITSSVYLFTLNSGLISNKMACNVTIDQNIASNRCATGTHDVANNRIEVRVTACDNSGLGLRTDAPFSVVCQRQGQDYINAKTLQQNVALKSYVQTPNTTGKVGFCSAKISAAGVISDQLGGCFASCTNATTPVCTFTSNYWKSGSVPNCWGISTDPTGEISGRAILSSSTFSQNILNGSLGAASGAREYFCHGEIQ